MTPSAMLQNRHRCYACLGPEKQSEHRYQRRRFAILLSGNHQPSIVPDRRRVICDVRHRAVIRRITVTILDRWLVISAMRIGARLGHPAWLRLTFTERTGILLRYARIPSRRRHTGT